MSNKRVFTRYILRATFLALGCLLAASQSLYASKSYPDDAVVVKFSIDPAVLSEVNNTADLIETLHQNLKLEAASPLDFEVIVHITGSVYQNRDQQLHTEGSGVIVSLEEDEPVEGLIKDIRFYTYGDFSESEAWSSFHDLFRSALLYSMNSSRAFQEDDNGQVWLTVSDVLAGTETATTDGSSMVLEITAEMLYRDGSKFGGREPPEGYRQVLETTQIVLAPAQAPESTPVAEAGSKDAPTEAVETAETDGITAVYGYDESGLKIEKKDGQYVMSDIRKSPPVYMPLTPIDDKRYSVDYNGVMVELSFSLDDQGQAFAVVILQLGHEMKLPRK